MRKAKNRAGTRTGLACRLVSAVGTLLMEATLIAAPVMAQGTGSGGEGRFKIGPVSFSPTISLSNVGYDSNVYNQTENPQGDYTATFTPAVDASMRIKRARLSGGAGLGLVYFRKNTSQRSAGGLYNGRFDIVLNRITPFVGAGRTNVRRRPTPEIDARVRQINVTASAGVGLRLSAKSTLTLEAGRGRSDYEDVDVLGTSVRTALNGRSESVLVSLRQQLTPLTAFVIQADTRRERFEFSSLRNSRTAQAGAGFDFKPLALVSGSIRVGVRRFETDEPSVPDYSGVTAAVDVATVLRATKLGLGVQRDVTYSVQSDRPYYVLFGVNGSVTQKLGRKWDVLARAGRQSLAYQGVATLPEAERNPTDHVYIYGTGLGYQVASTLNVGVNVDYLTRRSRQASLPEYNGLRIGGAMTYGF